MLIHWLILIFIVNIFKASSEETGKLSDVINNTVLITDKILQDTKNDIGTKHVKYGNEGSVTCSIKSSVPIHIYWYYVDETSGKMKQVVPSDKYWISNNGKELRIKYMDLDMVGRYICTGVYSQRVDIVLTAPKVTGKTQMRAITGSNVILECNILSGLPKPKIHWEYINKSGSKFNPIHCGNELRLQNVTDASAGRYKCVAENVVGKDEHVTTLIIEFPPRIISETTKVYEALEGDLALRIPCDVVGIPQPNISWKMDGNDIPLLSNHTKYVIEDGALVILNPEKNDGRSYTCEVINYLGSDRATFAAKIETYIDGLHSQSRYIYLLMGETGKVECEGYKSTNQSVRWFIEDTEVHTGKPYIEKVKASMSDDGNYTCRVNDIHGHAHTYTYVVDVGYAPEFYEQFPLEDWRGDITEIWANCDNTAKPPADVEWEFNGKVLSDRNLTEVGDTLKWGTYKCNVSNAHGSVQRSFDVKSSACLVNRKLEDIQNMPLLLTEERTWPSWKTTKHDLIVEQGATITLFCPSYTKLTHNSFEKFPKQSELKALCQNQDMFLVGDTNYTLSDLLCTNNIQPTLKRENIKCLTETSELIKVGYDLTGFLETYEVCYDHAKNITLYTRTVMTEADGEPTAVNNWYTFPEIGNDKQNRGFTCKKSDSNCCYGKTQLVNPRDFKYKSAKKSTYIDFLNTVPYLRSCAGDGRLNTWEDIEDMVRSQLANYVEFIVLSGTHTMQIKDGAVIPRYLWKVISFNDDESIAIIHVNDPSPLDKDIKCKDINPTNDGDVFWYIPSNKFTYYCTVSSFLKAFNMTGIKIRE